MEVLESKIKEVVKKAQRKEITEYHVYKILANRIKDEKEKQKILKIAEDEKRHYDVLKKFSGRRYILTDLRYFFTEFFLLFLVILLVSRLWRRERRFPRRIMMLWPSIFLML